MPRARRLINPQTMMLGQEPRQTTSNLGHLNKPSIQASPPGPLQICPHQSHASSLGGGAPCFLVGRSPWLGYFAWQGFEKFVEVVKNGFPVQALIHGLNRHYYSIAISYRKNELEERMLMNLQKKTWTHGLTLKCAHLLTSPGFPTGHRQGPSLGRSIRCAALDVHGIMRHWKSCSKRMHDSSCCGTWAILGHSCSHQCVHLCRM